MIDFSLKGKTALITGASRGIGEAAAKTLAAHGAHCILVSRKAESLEKVAEQIRKDNGEATVLACHMGHMDQIKALFEEVKTRFKGLDILINNAATNPFFGMMVDADEGIWDKTFDVNLKGPFFMIKNAAALMASSGGGAILNVSSVNGLRPAMFQGIYSISKTALISMTQAFAKELASSNIRVNALLPGITETKFAKAIIDNEDIYKFAIQQVPMGRHARPDEMSGAILYLVSDASSYTTGSCIVCDGGYLA